MSVTRPRPVIPEGLPELLHSLSFSVIKERPKDIISFAADHFSQLFEEREEERRELAEKAKNKKEDYFQDADAYAWRAGYYDPEEWQTMPDLKLPKGSLYEKYGDQFRLVEDDEEERKRRSLEARTKTELESTRAFSQTEEITTGNVYAQTSEDESQVKEEPNSFDATEVLNSSQVNNESSTDPSPEAHIQIKIEVTECEKDSNDSQTDNTEELSSNPDSETVSLGSSENLSTDD